MDVAFSTNDSYGREEFMLEAQTAPQGICRRCDNVTELMCMRCGDCYCSKRCQDIDWAQHRYICFPKPPLVKLNSIPTAENVPDLGVVEPVHLKAQLNIMSNVCHEFMRLLDTKYNFNENNAKEKNVFEAKRKQNSNQKQQSPPPPQQQQQTQENYLMTNGNSSNSSKNEFPSTTKKPTTTSTTPTEHANSEEIIVKIVGFRSSNRVALCPYKFNERHQQVLERIHNYGQNAIALKSPPLPNSFVITQKSGRYVRAKVITQKYGDRIRLELLDFGQVCNRKLQDLRYITIELAQLPSSVKLFSLSGLQHFDFKDNLSQLLNTFEERCCRMIKVAGTPPDKFAIMLYDINSGANINETIEKLYQNKQISNDNYNANNSNNNNNTANGNAQNNKNECHDRNRLQQQQQQQRQDFPLANVSTTRGKEQHEPAIVNFTTKTLQQEKQRQQQQQQSSCSEANETVCDLPSTSHMLVPPFKEHIFPKNLCNAKAAILDATAAEEGYIACILQTDLPYLEEVQNSLKMKDLGESYQPIVDEYVLAKFENEWYRGKVLKISPDGKKFDISYIDFLNESILTSADIRRYPADLTTDCYTTLCLLDGLPNEISDNLKEFLKNRLEVYEVITIDRVVDISDERLALIENSELLNIMRNKKLI